MKKRMISLFLMSGLILGSQVFFAKEMEATKESNQQTLVKEEKSSNLTKEVINIHGEGQIKWDTSKGKVSDYEFVPFKDDGIELQANGTYIGQKAGKYTFTPYYIEKNATAKKGKVTSYPLKEVTVEVRDQEQIMLNVTSGYDLTKSDYFIEEEGVVTRQNFQGIEMIGEFTPIKTSTFEVDKNGTIKALNVGKEELELEYILADETEVALKEAFIKESTDEVTLDDITVVDQNKKSLLSLEVTPKNEIGQEVILEVRKEYTIDQPNLKVGELATVMIKPVNGIELTGEYQALDNPIISLNNRGTLVARKEGKTQFIPEMMLSEESKMGLKEAYLKESQREDLALDDIKVIEKNQEAPIEIQVNSKEEPKIDKLTIDVTPSFYLDKQSFNVGETGGRLTVNPIHGISVKGEFKEIKNPVIDFKKDGTFMGLQAGSVELAPSFKISDESLDEIANLFLSKSENAHLTREDVEFAQKDVQPIFPIQFTAPSGNNNSGGKSGKNYVPVEEKRVLPQTGETGSFGLSILGICSLLGGSLLFRKNN